MSYKGRAEQKSCYVFSCPFFLCLTMHEMYSPTPCKASYILEGTCAQVQNHCCIQQQAHRDKNHYLSDVLYLQTWRGK